MDTLDGRRAAAIKRIENKREFKYHALIYVMVNTMLIIIWAISGAEYFWPIWPMAGWGIAVGLHAWTTFGQQPISEADIADELQRESGRSTA